MERWAVSHWRISEHHTVPHTDDSTPPPQATGFLMGQEGHLSFSDFLPPEAWSHKGHMSEDSSILDFKYSSRVLGGGGKGT